MPTVRLLFLLLAAMLLAAKAAPSDQVDECLDIDYAVKQCAPGLPARLTASAPPLFADRAARAVQTRRAARAAATKSRGDGANQSQHFAALRPTNSATAPTPILARACRGREVCKEAGIRVKNDHKIQEL